MEKARYRFFAPLLVIIYLMIPFPVSSQEPYFSRIRFSLPATEPVFHIAVQDQAGYLWLAANEGLFRFDGINFTEYKHGDESLKNITALYRSPDSVLWIGRKDGSIMMLKKDQMTPFTPEEGTAGTGISDFISDNSGRIWWSTYGEGVYCYSNQRVFNFNHDDGMGDDYVYDLESDGSGHLYAATDNGLSEIWFENGEKKAEDMTVNPDLPDIIVRTITRDPSDRLWLGFQDAGVALIGGEDHQLVMHSPSSWDYGPIEDAVFTGNTLWTATSNSGIVALREDGHQQVVSFISEQEGNPFGRIYQLLNDREDNIWVLSSNGLFRTTGTRMQYLIRSAANNFTNIHAVMKDSRGYLWYSNDQGIFRFDFGTNTSRTYLSDLSSHKIKFMCIKEDRQGMVWAGTFDYGLVRIDPNSGVYRRITENDGLINNNVLSISTHNDTLWMATLGGATRIILKGDALDCPLEFTSFGKETGLGIAFIYDVYEDPMDRVWFATDGDGINMWSGGKFTSLNESSGLKDDVIYSITGDKNGNIWFTTANDGVYRYDGTGFMQIGNEAGLRSLEISALEVSNDEVVVVHDLGIDILHLPSMEFTHYGNEAGLGQSTPELNSIDKDPEGVVWIGTRNGIISYMPGSPESLSGPGTVLEEMLVFMQHAEMSPELSLKGSENHISFRYSGIWLSDPEKVIYRVMLEGYDLDWKDTYDKLTTYSSLRPGKYTFHVKSALDPTFSQASEVSYQFRISRPIWQQVWFILLIIAAVATSIYFYIRFRENRLRGIERQKKEKVEFEFQLLKNQVNPHFLFNSFSTLISLIEEDRDQAAEYTEKLSDFFRKILQLKDEQVIPLTEELGLIKDYLFIQSKRYGDLIHLDVSLDEKTLRSSIPPMTLQMLMENAVKHNIISKDQPLMIRLYSDNEWLVVENDYQPKRLAETSTGIGLENIVKRYRLLAGREIMIENTGKVFKVKLPVI
jgi:ligand-binding sensor domain-containing protein